jgi:ATP-dependent Clp protease ATP-binding subunit ClpX
MRFSVLIPASTRFVKCDNCNHFFVVLSDVDARKTREKTDSATGTAEAQSMLNKPPPPPKKVTVPFRQAKKGTQYLSPLSLHRFTSTWTST